MSNQAKCNALPTTLVDSVISGDVEKTKALLNHEELDINYSVDSRGRNLLHVACTHGHIDQVRFLILLGANVSKLSYHEGGRFTPLATAVLNNHTNIVSALVSEFGCDPNDGVTLHTVCEHGDPSMVKTLIDHGANVNDKDINGNTPLHVTVRNETNQITLALLRDLECGPNSKDRQGRTPLHIACTYGNLNGVKLLIEYGASMSDRDIAGNTPLALAVLNDHDSTVSALLSEFGCDPNDEVTLHTACKHGNLSIVKTLVHHGAYVNDEDVHGNLMLIQHGAHVNDRDIDSQFGCDPNDGEYLHTACRLGNMSMVETLIDHGAKVNDKDIDGKYTPLALAVLKNHTRIVSALLNEFGCDPNDGVSLHTACECGNLSMVNTLIDHGAYVNDQDEDGSTPLHVTVKSKNSRITLALLCNAKCNPDAKDRQGRTPLHVTCMYGNLSVVKLLINFRASKKDRNVDGKTPLALAIQYQSTSFVSALVSEFGCDPNDGVSLHAACECGNLSMVKTLVDHGANVNDKGIEGKYTPLALAALNNHINIVSALLNEFGCDPNDGVSLHAACKHGNLSMVKTLVDHGANVNDKGIEGKYTPLALAVLDHNCIVLGLLSEFGCDPNDGVSLHTACEHGNLSMVKTLIDHGAHVNDRDVDGNTPLHMTARNETNEIALAILRDSKCDPNIINKKGRTPLQAACRYGNLSGVKLLIKYCASVNDEDVNGETILMTAVSHNQCEVVKLLISEYGCDVNVRGRGKRSLLHVAATECGKEMLRLLINEYGMSPLLVDEEGNTPLHLCSQYHKNDGNVHTLLHDFHSPVYVRNRAGKKPRDVANYSANRVFQEYILKHQGTLEEDYKSMQKLAATRYSGSHHKTKLFVVGHPGAGKSSLVEALKREGFIQSFNRVSSKSVALHTAGIVPSIHTSDSYGRVQFYDFAGDPEYYSSHAAILEKLFLSDIGNNICIIVLDLQDVELEKKYHYWLTFISHNTKNLQHPPSVIVIGSHADLLSKEGMLQKKEDYIKTLFRKHGNDHVYLSLDCCGPRSNNIRLLRQQIQKLSKNHQPYDLSYEASILLGLLEKDFSNVAACTAKTVVNHIVDVNLLRLPRSLPNLYPVLKQLQDIGLLLILGGKEGDCYLVLNVPQLTTEVHERLFSEKSFFSTPDLASFNIGLLPESLLQDILPSYITKECLTQLQYCQEVTNVEIGQDYFISPSSEGADISSSPDDKSLLFFPALCKLDRSNVSWQEGSYSIGWLARCSNPHDYFPPRFLHVLLLRVSLRFTLIALADLQPSQDTPPNHVHLKRRCKMWKTGVHWLTEEGVECEVDVDISKEVVVSIRSEEHSKEVLTVFNNIVSCVMEAKAEFCHSIQLKYFLLDKVGCLSEDNLFRIEEVERVLEEGKKKVVSVKGDTWMSSLKLLYIRSTFWDSLFLLDERSVLQYIEALVDEWFQLGVNLELPYHILKAIERKNHDDVMRHKVEMVITWLSSSHSHPPCWWSLVKALQEMGENASAAAIIRDKGELIAIQKKLLESDCSCVKQEDEFLRSFSGVVSSKWPYLAALLSLGGSEIKEVRKEGEGLSQSDHAFLMLSKWASREGATYGQLYKKLKPTSIFQLRK